MKKYFLMDLWTTALLVLLLTFNFSCSDGPGSGPDTNGKKKKRDTEDQNPKPPPKEIEDHELVGTNCRQGQEAFARTTFALVRQHCIGCHGGNGPGPGFATAVVGESYRIMRNRVNFGNIDQSTVVRKCRSGHCPQPVTAEVIKDTLLQWWEGGEADCAQVGNFVTETQMIPEDLPVEDELKPEQYVTMQWDLGAIANRFRGISLELKMKQFSVAANGVPGSYIFSAPRILGSAQPVKVKGLRLFINEQVDVLADGFATIEQTTTPQIVNSRTSPHGLLSARQVISLEVNGPGKDMIAVSFEDLDFGERAECRFLDVFRTRVMPAMEMRRCYTCHGGGPDNEVGRSGTAMRFFPMDVDDATLCAAALQRTDREEPFLSAFLLLPLERALYHPQVFPSFSEIGPGYLDWIYQELEY